MVLYFWSACFHRFISIPDQPGEVVHKQSKPNYRSEYALFTGKCDSATMKRRLKMFKKVLVLAVIATVFVYANVAKAQFVTEGLVSYWNFESMTNGTVADALGKNDGTIVGDAKTATGKVGNAVEFDGDGDYVDCGNNESLNFDSFDPFTICAWIKGNEGRLEVVEPWQLWGQAIAGKIDANWHGYLLTVTGVGHPDEPYTLNGVLSHELGGIDINSSTPDNSMEIVTDWTYVCMSYEGTSDVAGIHLSINGEDQPVSSQRDNLTKTMANAAPFTIGTIVNAGDGSWPVYFDGFIDEVAVYNRGLDEDEVSQNYDAGGVAVEPTSKLALTWGEIKASK